MKKAMATILALVMIIGLLPIIPANITAFAAASGSCGDNITWSIENSGTLTITGYGAMDDYATGSTPPWSSWNYIIKRVVFENTGSGITKIGFLAFGNCYNLTEVILPPTLETVGAFAFYGCSKLKDFSIPESVTNIGGLAFYECESLTRVPSDSRLKSVTSLGNAVFSGCTGITEAIIPPSLTTVPNKSYSGCTGLVEVVIPENITSIGESAFSGCTGLQVLVLTDGVVVVNIEALSGCTSLSKVFINNSSLTINEKAFDGCPTTTEFCIAANESDFIRKATINADNASYEGAKHTYRKSFAVVLDPNGGSGGIFGETGMPRTYIKTEGQTLYIDESNSAIPARDGYTFLSWNTKPDGNGAFYWPGKDYKYDGPLYLYAYWLENPTENDIIRLSGSSRNGTAVEISRTIEEEIVTCNAVVLANGWNFADALAGGPLAYALDAPILLITGDEKDEETYAEIKRLGVNKVYILGGTVAVSDDVKTRLQGEGYDVHRIAGDNRFETAVKIGEMLNEVRDSKLENHAFFVYSHNYPDALAVSGVAAVKGAPILYVDSEGVLDPSTEAFVESCEFDKGYIIGGKGAISSDAEDNILNAGAKDVTRIAGSTRYETCLKINKAFLSTMDGGSVFVTTGVNFPDALAGGVLAACYRSPMMLVAPDEPLSDAQKEYFKGYFNNYFGDVFIFGGKVAIPEEIENELKYLVP